MSDILKSHRFTVRINDADLGVMKVAGLSPEPGTVMRLTRAVYPPYDFLSDWSKARDQRQVAIDLLPSLLVSLGSGDMAELGGSEALMSFRFIAKPKAYYYSELDAGSNQIFTENLQLIVSSMRITHTLVV